MRYIKIITIGALIFLLSYMVILSCLPPISKDALTHHLAIPKLYLENGGIYEIPSILFSYFPMNLELIYMIPIYFGNDIIPKFIHFAFALFTSWLIYAYIKDKLDKNYALMGILYFLSIPIIIKLSTSVYVDLGLIFFSTASLLYVFRWMEEGFKFRYVILSGVCCGLAMGTKYNGLVTACLIALLIPFSFSRIARQETSEYFKPVAYTLVFFVVSMAVFSPWMVRNYMWKRNPIYPLYDRWFQSDSESGEERRIGYGVRPGSGLGLFNKREISYGETGWEVALLPIRVFFQGKDGDPRLFDGRLNPFLLILPLFAFLGTGRDPPLVRYQKGCLLAFAALYFCIVFFTREMRIRYIAPMIPPLVILSVFGTRNLFLRVQRASSFRGRLFGGVGLGAGFLLVFGYSADYMVEQFRYLRPLSYLSGSVDRAAYITHYRPEYPVIQYANRNLPRDAKVLLVFMGMRGYYLDREYVPGVDLLGRMVLNATNPEDVFQALRQDNITNLLVCIPIFNKWVEDNLDQNKARVLGGFLQTHTTSLCVYKGYGLFALK